MHKTKNYQEIHATISSLNSPLQEQLSSLGFHDTEVVWFQIYPVYVFFTVTVFPCMWRLRTDCLPSVLNFPSLPAVSSPLSSSFLFDLPSSPFLLSFSSFPLSLSYPLFSLFLSLSLFSSVYQYLYLDHILQIDIQFISISVVSLRNIYQQQMSSNIISM